MSSQEITEDAGAIKRKVEQQSVNIMEWSAEIDMAAEASELGLPGMDTTTEAFKPGDGVVKMTPTRVGYDLKKVLRTGTGFAQTQFWFFLPEPEYVF